MPTSPADILLSVSRIVSSVHHGRTEREAGCVYGIPRSVIPANRELLPCQSAETGAAATAVPQAPTVVISPMAPTPPQMPMAPPPHQYAVPSAPTQHAPPSYPATSAYPQQPMQYPSQYPTCVSPSPHRRQTPPSSLGCVSVVTLLCVWQRTDRRGREVVTRVSLLEPFAPLACELGALFQSRA